MARRYTSTVSRQVTWGLGVLMLAAILGVGLATYLAIARTTITVTIKPVTQAAEFSLTVKPSDATLVHDEVAGTLAETTVIGSAKQSVGEKQMLAGTSHGHVTITNTWSQPQPLAATTRLLSSDGILFRTTARVDVPARGSVVADVVADQRGAQGDIGPSTFSIPGLSTDLQQRITGKSDTAMSGGLRQSGILNETDLETALAAARADAEAKIASWQPELPSRFSLIPGLLGTTTLVSKKTDAAAGDQTDGVTATVTLHQRVVALEQNTLDQRAQRELAAGLPPGMELTDAPISYRLVDQQINLEKGVFQGANVRLRAVGVTRPSLGEQAFSAENLTGRTSQEINDVLLHTEFVDKVEIRFAPFWAHRSSRLPDHIIVTMKR